jgi:hypothetical protein
VSEATVAWGALPQWRRDYALEQIEESAAEWEQAAKTKGGSVAGKSHCVDRAADMRLAVKILREVAKG